MIPDFSLYWNIYYMEKGLHDFVVPPDSQHPSQVDWSGLLWHFKHHETPISVHGTCQDTHPNNVMCLLMGVVVTEQLLLQCQQYVFHQFLGEAHVPADQSAVLPQHIHQFDCHFI